MTATPARRTRQHRRNAFSETRNDEDVQLVQNELRARTDPAPSEPSTPAPVLRPVVKDAPASVSRPPARKAEPTATVKLLVGKVPLDLYESMLPLVKGPNRPSWGQLVGLVCARQGSEVVAEIVRERQEAQGLFVPRSANRSGTATTQVTPRLNSAEHAAFLAWCGCALPHRARGVVALWCPRRDSNPHSTHFKWAASAGWATGAAARSG